LNTPSISREVPFLAAVDESAGIVDRLLRSLETGLTPKNQEEEAAKSEIHDVKALPQEDELA